MCSYVCVKDVKNVQSVKIKPLKAANTWRKWIINSFLPTILEMVPVELMADTCWVGCVFLLTLHSQYQLFTEMYNYTQTWLFSSVYVLSIDNTFYQLLYVCFCVLKEILDILHWPLSLYGNLKCFELTSNPHIILMAGFIKKNWWI